jgi:hypothetical protein
MNQTQKMKIDPTKPWPFKWVDGVDTSENCIEVLAPNARVKVTKEPKCKLYDTFDDLGEPLF